MALDLNTINAPTTNTAAKSGRDAIAKAQENQDRFLTLLVAQMRNQDPMNPMENAQLTTQIAQIQTVTGIENLRTSLDQMAAQATQAQTLQGVAMIGRNITTEGSRLQVLEDGAVGSFELDTAADQVSVDITTAAGTVVQTLNLGTLGAGRHDFVWDRQGLDPAVELNFKLKATRGTTPVKGTTFSRDAVMALNNEGGALNFILASGRTIGLDKILSVD
ncbi:flagellar hook assembly protein FlgD [Inhella gelatinilytica]|uniref:Basal-body rod modification protein FlgD n=1 Tax=Inhella gelatinilytica TaxID=2795030 RepID=A0A931IXS2_9BURK|nr:flagellar hook capping FlgD N-terminal domain-containing protein [Inhella gelatinilytica]MBH9553541.1 flagellar hook assembly protein FlgD [Inhella gelatinilytica]